MKFIAHENLQNDAFAFEEICLRDDDETKVVKVPPMIWYQLYTPTDDDGMVMNMPNLAWKPDYSDQVKASTWTEAKEMIV